VPDDVAVVGYDLGVAEQIDGGRGGHPMRVIFPPSLARRASA